MTTPPKYEDVVAQLDAVLGREAALREELDNVRDLHSKQCCVFCNDTGNLRAVHADLQQRLTVAEQRSAVMEKALSRIAREHDCGCSPCTGSCTSQVALEITVDAMRDIAIAALKPAAQHQGEPVAEVYRGPVSGINRISWVNSRTQPVGAKLYAEQSAPVELDYDAAAKKLAECMDYPWDHMPEQGRQSMLAHAKTVVDAARLNGVKP